MNRRIASVAIVAALLLAVGACSKSNDTTATNNTQAQSATTAGKTDTTKGDSGDNKTPDTKSTGTTRSGNTGTTRRGGNTGTTSKSGMPQAKNLETTPEEEACFEEKITAAIQANPELATQISGNDATAAGVVGGLLAACVLKPKLADALVSGIKDETSLSDTEASCVRDQIISLDTEQLGTLIGLVIFSAQKGNNAALAPIASAINQKCNTKIPA